MPDLVDLGMLNVFHAMALTLIVVGLTWAVSAHNSLAHKLAGSVFITAAAAVITLLIVGAIPRVM